MAAKKPPTVKGHVLQLILRAGSLCATARDDLLRNDRIDTLDSLRLAAKKIEQAQTVIRETLP
jgi:hypothetical protein